VKKIASKACKDHLGYFKQSFRGLLLGQQQAGFDAGLLLFWTQKKILYLIF